MERLKQEKPVLDAFLSWIDSTNGKILPRSKLGEAMKYALDQKDELFNFLLDGSCCILNNLVEDSMCPFTT